jgi:hypothetical protein
VPLGVTLGIYLLGAWYLKQRPRSAPLLAWALAGSVLLALASLYVSSHPFFKLFGVTVGCVATGWHYAAARITNLGAALRNWPGFMREALSFSSHVSISPPGPIVLYYAANQALARFPVLATAFTRLLRTVQWTVSCS